MYWYYSLCITWALLVGSFSPSQSQPSSPVRNSRKIVLIAGEKSHPPGTHEYVKTVRLLKAMLDHCQVPGLRTEVHLHGWPEPEQTLDDADLIFFVSDGRDGNLFSDVPFMTPERIQVMEKQMKRGCSLALLHFSNFASYAYGQKLLEWTGGYYDWEDATGKYRTYSALKILEADVRLPSPEHPISRGVKPFRINDEFYYNLRFRENDPRLTPILEVPALQGRPPQGNLVAWALQRADGSRGFCATFNHFYTNWENPDYRKLLLNGLVWAAGAEVPETGVDASFYTDAQVTELTYHQSKKALLFHDKKTKSSLQQTLEKDPGLLVDVCTDLNDLSTYDLSDYGFLAFDRPDTNGIHRSSKAALEQYVQKGGGLLALAFRAKADTTVRSGWAAYSQLFRREKITDFRVDERVKRESHPLTKGLPSFRSKAAFQLKGTEPIEVIVRSKSTPLAWVYTFGQGRVFQTVIDPETSPAELWRRAANWVSKKQ